MNDLNKCFLTGKVVDDVEWREKVVYFILEVTLKYHTKSGEKSAVNYFEIFYYGKRNDVKQYLKKGANVLVEGTISPYVGKEKDIVKKVISSNKIYILEESK